MDEQLINKVKFDEPDIFILECCNEPNLQMKEGFYSCINCGMIYSQSFDEAEQRAYTIEERNNKLFREPKLTETGPRTIIPRNNLDFYGNYLKKQHQSLFKRLSKINNSLDNGYERNLYRAKLQFNRLAETLNLVKHARVLAWRLYKNCVRANLIQGRTIIQFIGASIYIAARQFELPIEYKDICNDCFLNNEETKNLIYRTMVIMVKELKIKCRPISPKTLILKYGNKMNISIDLQIKALNLYDLAKKNGFSINGMEPKGIAGACLYIMLCNYSEVRINQEEISLMIKISKVTLRKCRDLILDKIELPNKKLRKISCKI